MIAGSSLPLYHNETNESEPPCTTCEICNASNFHLRIGPNYSKKGLKFASPPGIMKLLGVDMVSCESRQDNIGSRMVFPDEWGVTPDVDKDSSVAKLPSDVPSVFIVNVQIPSNFTSSVFREVTDGPGWSLVFYYKWTEESIQILNDTISNATNNATKMLSEYLKSGTTVDSAYGAPGTNETASVKESKEFSKWRGRFKVIINGKNLDDFGLPNFITSYNSKPILIRNTGTLVKCLHPSGFNYCEFDINVHRFGSVPKKALSTLINSFDKMFMEIGFCIESRENDEMPETITGCVLLNKPDPKSAPRFPN